MSPLIAVFVTVFLAELGDKTQLATLLFASDGAQRPMHVFFAAAAALVASTALAVLLGTVAQSTMAALPLKLIAGIGFIIIGGLTVWQHFQA